MRNYLIIAWLLTALIAVTACKSNPTVDETTDATAMTEQAPDPDMDMSATPEPESSATDLAMNETPPMDESTPVESPAPVESLGASSSGLGR